MKIPLWRSTKRCERNRWSNLPCARRQHLATNARPTVCLSRHHTCRGSSVLTWRFPRACAAHRPLIGNSRPSTSSPSSICSGSPTGFVHAFSEQPRFFSSTFLFVGLTLGNLREQG